MRSSLRDDEPLRTEPRDDRLPVDALDRLVPRLEDALDRLVPRLEDALDRLEPRLDDALDRLVPRLEDALDRLEPRLDDALDRLEPRLEDAFELPRDDPPLEALDRLEPRLEDAFELPREDPPLEAFALLDDDEPTLAEPPFDPPLPPPLAIWGDCPSKLVGAALPTGIVGPPPGVAVPGDGSSTVRSAALIALCKGLAVAVDAITVTVETATTPAQNQLAAVVHFFFDCII